MYLYIGVWCLRCGRRLLIVELCSLLLLWVFVCMYMCKLVVIGLISSVMVLNVVVFGYGVLFDCENMVFVGFDMW